MKRKEINIFSMSFLDLLSGALGAVIILFIVVPKMDAKSKETQEVMDELNLEASQLAEMVERLENSVDSSIYKSTMEQLNQVEESLAGAKQNMQELQNDLTESQAEYAEAQNRVGQLKKKVERTSQELQQTRESLDEMKLFGVDAELAIICKWDIDVDVDLYLYSHQEQSWCYFEGPYRRTRFGELLKDQTQATGESYEMIYQPKLVEGKYDLYMNVYRSTARVEVEGYIVLFPTDQARTDRLPIDRRVIQGMGVGAEKPAMGQLTPIKSFTVTASGIN